MNISAYQPNWSGGGILSKATRRYVAVPGVAAVAYTGAWASMARCYFTAAGYNQAG